MHRVVIQPDFENWRWIARELLTRQLPPEEVLFDDGGSDSDLLPGLAGAPAPADPAERVAFTVPARFMDLARLVADHRDPDRWHFLYRLLWRLCHEPGLRDNMADADLVCLEQMAKSVRRDVHKMHAFVRFRKIQAGDGEHYIAFHRPDHHILRRAVPFFRERFGGMHWTILTPGGSASWDGHSVCFGPGVGASAAPAEDALEDVWRTYYASVFNPARIKLRAMRAEMPVRHWRTLPETKILPDLLSEAPRRVELMMATAGRQPKTSATDFLPPKLTLPAMKRAVQGCRGCDLCCQKGVTQAVFGEGPDDARCIMVGEQPGDSEDRAGRPFVGPAGQLLDDLLEQGGVDRREVYVTNAVKHFRFDLVGQRRIHSKPLARHVNACLPWLEAEAKVLQPKMIVALGSTAAQAIMGRDFRVTRQRGQVLTCPYAQWFLATIHPSAILRIPEDEARHEAKAAFVDDMRKVARQLKQAG